MADDGDDARVSARFSPRPPGPARRDSEPPPPPPRPPVSNLTPAPVKPPVPPPAAISVARSLLFASFVLGFLAIGLAFLTRSAQVQELRRVIEDLLPDESESTLERAAGIIFWASILALVVVIVTQALLLRLVMNRRRGARWALVLFLVVHTGVAFVAGGFLGVGDAGPYLLLFLGGQLLLAGISAVASVLPGTARWFRAEHQPR